MTVSQPLAEDSEVGRGGVHLCDDDATAHVPGLQTELPA